MKNPLLLFIFLNTIAYAQSNKKRFKIDYVNMTSLSITKNTESYFTTDSISSADGLAFDLNTIHGVKLFGHVALSGGIALDWNINKTFLSTPFIVDVRVFSSEKMDESFFAYLQTGQNLKWSDSFDGHGTTSKLGVGALFSYDADVSYFVDIFRKSKSIELADNRQRGNYNATGYGISLGIIF